MEWSPVPQIFSFASEYVDPFCYILPPRAAGPGTAQESSTVRRYLKRFSAAKLAVVEPSEVVARVSRHHLEVLLAGTDVFVSLGFVAFVQVLQRQAAPQQHQLPQLRPPTLPQPSLLGIEGARNKEHSTGTVTPHRRANLAPGSVPRISVQQGLCRELFWARLDCYQSCVACFSVPPLCDDAPAPCHRLCLTQHVIAAILTMINRTCVANLAIFQRRWRLAHAFCFVDQLAFIARGRPRRTLCRASELPAGRGYVSRNL